MIARVRIAPMEAWCADVNEVFEDNPLMAHLPGTPVEIETESLRTSLCGNPCKEWRLTKGSQRRLDEIVTTADPRDGEGEWICEHMLEMD